MVGNLVEGVCFPTLPHFGHVHQRHWITTPQQQQQLEQKLFLQQLEVKLFLQQLEEKLFHEFSNNWKKRVIP